MTLLFFLLAVHLVRSDTVVNTNSGPIRGISLTEKKVDAFLGIPYAEPPLGERRFAKPIPKSPWEKIYNADKLPPACVQARLKELFFPYDAGVMSEDCLFLNLWVPHGGSQLKSIMLFIHGGGYMIGSSNMNLYDGAALSERGDVIVATINYRVGTLGFFAGFIDDAPGNMGMYDQVMAIQWIKDNAKHFGGDPDNIVLFGESAGAFSVSMHMVSPLSKNLFRRSILQSGTVYHPMYSDDNAVSKMGSQIIASMLGCDADKELLQKNPKQVVDCMKRLPPEKISEIDLMFLQTYGLLLPRVGDDFLPSNPVDLFQKGKAKDSELLLGVTRNEGSSLLTFLKSDVFGKFGDKVDAHSFNETSAKEAIHFITQLDGDNEIFQSYFDRVKETSRYSYLDVVADVTGDFYITCGVVFQADFQSLRDTPVYFYSFEYRPASTNLAEWAGVAHFEELQYVFGNPLYKDFTEFEEEFSKDIMDMWVAFAKTGNPSIPGQVKWPHYTFEDPKYYILSQRDGVGVKPDRHRCEPWRNFYRSVIDDATMKSLKNTDG